MSFSGIRKSLKYFPLAYGDTVESAKSAEFGASDRDVPQFVIAIRLVDQSSLIVLIYPRKPVNIACQVTE
jgi:hypothetical protein